MGDTHLGGLGGASGLMGNMELIVILFFFFFFFDSDSFTAHGWCHRGERGTARGAFSTVPGMCLALRKGQLS